MANIESNTLLDKLNEINSIKNRTRQALIDVGGGDYLNEQSPFSEFPAVIKQLFSDTKSADQLCEYILNGGSLDDIISGDKVEFSQFVPYLVKFQQNKSLLVNNLRLKGVECSIEESLESLLGKILDIDGGEPSPGPSPGPDPEGLLFSTIVDRGDYSLKFDAIDLGGPFEENGNIYYKIRYTMTNVSSSAYDGVIVKVVFLSTGETNYYNDSNVGPGSSYKTDFWYTEEQYTFAKNELVNSNVSIFFDLLEYCTPIDFDLHGNLIGYNNLEVSGTRYVSSYLGITYISLDELENPQELPGRVAICYINNEYNNYGMIFNEEVYYGGYNTIIFDSNKTTELFLCNYNEDLLDIEWSYDNFYCLYLDYSGNFDGQMYRNIYTGNNSGISMYYEIMKINNVGVYVRNIMQTNDETEIPYNSIKLSQMYLDSNDNEFTLDTYRNIPNRAKFKIRQLFKFDNNNDINSCYMTFDEVVSLDPENSQIRLIKSQILSKDDIKLRYKIIDYGIDNNSNYIIRREISNLTNNEIKHLIIAEEYSVSRNDYGNLIHNGTIYPEDWWFNYEVYGGHYDGVNLQGYGQSNYEKQIEQLDSITSLYLITDEDYIKKPNSLDIGVIGYNGYTEEVGLYYSEDLNFTMVDYASYDTNNPQSYGNMYVENGLNILAIDLNNQKHLYISSFNKNSNISLRSKFERLFEGNYLNYTVFLAQYDDYSRDYGTYNDAYNAYMKYYGKNYNDYEFKNLIETNSYNFNSIGDFLRIEQTNDNQILVFKQVGNNIKTIPMTKSGEYAYRFMAKIEFEDDSSYMINDTDENILEVSSSQLQDVINGNYTFSVDTNLSKNKSWTSSNPYPTAYDYRDSKSIVNVEGYRYYSSLFEVYMYQVVAEISPEFRGKIIQYFRNGNGWIESDCRWIDFYEKYYTPKENTYKDMFVMFHSYVSDFKTVAIRDADTEEERNAVSKYIGWRSGSSDFCYMYSANASNRDNICWADASEVDNGSCLMCFKDSNYYYRIRLFYTYGTPPSNIPKMVCRLGQSGSIVAYDNYALISDINTWNDNKNNIITDYFDDVEYHKTLDMTDSSGNIINTAEIFLCENTQTIVILPNKYLRNETYYVKNSNDGNVCSIYAGYGQNKYLFIYTKDNNYNTLLDMFNDIDHITK